nr:hypothetical protein [Angustibacter aerolatus]
MDPITLVIAISVLIVLALVGAGVGLVRGRGRTRRLPQRPGTDYVPGVGDDATTPRDTPTRTIQDAPTDLLDRPPLDEPGVPGQVTETEPGRRDARRARAAGPARAAGRRRRAVAPPAGPAVAVERSARQGPARACSRATGSTRTPGTRSRRPCWRRTSASARPPSLVDRLRRQVKVDGVRDPEQVRALLRSEPARAGRPRRRPVARDARRGPAGRRPGRRGERHRQDHDRRQARPRAGRRAARRRARRGRHLPRGRRRPGSRPGAAASASRRSALPATAATRRPWPTTR